MIKRMLLLMLIILIPVCFCTGCWDVEEVNRRALPNVLYFDLGEQEKVQMGIDFHVPGTLLPPVNSTNQQFEKNHNVLYAEGKTSLEAWTKLQTMTSRTVFFGQLRSIIISDTFARQDIGDSLDFLGRMPFVTQDTHILITREDPKQLIDLKNKSNFIPGNYIESYFQSPYKKMLAKSRNLFEIFASIDNKTIDPYCPMISTNQGNYLIAGTAVFSGTHLVGELNQEETYAFSLLNGDKTGFLTVPMGDNRLVSYLQMNTKSKIDPTYNSNGSLNFNVNVEVEAIIAETNPYQGQLSVEDKKKLNQAGEDFIKGEIEKLLIKLQQLNSDPVGFGEKFRSKYPDLWEKTDWHQVYPRSQFAVNVKFNAKKTGLFR